jgi:predicted DNA-binding transcriptional regulator YafY
MHLLSLLPQHESLALTTRELTQKFFERAKDDPLLPKRIRMIQRYLEVLSNDTDHARAPIVKVSGSHPAAYYLCRENFADCFMTDRMALNLLLAKEALKIVASSDVIGTESYDHTAAQLVNASPGTKRIWSKVRMARSGIGRQPPKVDPQVMTALLQAVRQDRQLHREYVSSTGVRTFKDITVQGLVMKDDTLYVLATHGLSDPPQHLAAHRILKAEVLHMPTHHRNGFDLEAYIEQDYQLSHVTNRGKDVALIELKISIRADYLYHFIERPLTLAQIRAPDFRREGWSHLTAMIPETYMLKQFLQSMGPGIEVMAPAGLRQQMTDDARQSAALYD